MTTEKIYGPRIKWHGGECPVPPDTRVKVKFRCGVPESEDRAGNYLWNHDGVDFDIVEYCTVTEQPVLEAAEKLLRAHGHTVIPPAKPLTFEDVVPMTEMPPANTEFWIVSASVEGGVYRALAGVRGFDSRAIKRRMAYLDKEHALIAAKHIFGLKGGEL